MIPPVPEFPAPQEHGSPGGGTLAAVILVLAAAALVALAVWHGTSERGAGPLSNNPGYLGRGF